MTTDLTFITNENGQSLKDRFNVLIKDSRFFDVLSGYFYTSGFYAIYKSLENNDARSHETQNDGRLYSILSLKQSFSK